MLAEVGIAFRSLLRTPGLSLVIVLMLALGIGANTAIFSMVKAVLLSPVPYPQPNALVLLWEKSASFDFAAISWPDLQDWRERSESFSAIGGFRRASFRYSDHRGPEMLTGMQAEASLFEALQISPLLGRLYTRDEDKAGAPGLALVSFEFWQRRFGGDPAVMGRTLNLNAQAYTVIGVLPPELQLDSQLGLSLQRGAVDIWTQLGRLGDQPDFQNRQNHPGILAIGRLRPGTTFEQAMTELSTISAGIKQQHPHSMQMDASGAPLLDKAVEGYESLWLLQAAVGLVLLIACANIATLLGARGAARESELAVRAALGAPRKRLMQQLLTESVLLALAGGALGLLIAYWAHGGITALDPPGTVVLRHARLDLADFAVAALLSLITALVFGLWPAQKAARPNLQAALQASGRTSSEGGGATRARSILIVTQVALSVMLLAGAGLLLKSFMRAQAVDLGFSSQGIVTARLELPSDTYDSAEKIRYFTDRLLERVRALPAVSDADVAASLPLESGWQATYSIEGRAPPEGGLPFAEMNVVSDSYFRTLQIPMLRGRSFGSEDVPAGETAVIIDQGSAERHWPHQDPIGQRIRLNDTSVLTVVGVIPTLRLYGYAREPQLLQAYLSARQNELRSLSLVVRAQQDAVPLANAVRLAVREIDPAQPIWDVSTFDDRIAETVSNVRLYTFLFGIFSSLALLLAMTGLYGLLAFQVTSRTRELGIQIALGARHRQIMAQVLAAGMKLLTIGLVVGVAGALLLGRAMSALLYRTHPIDLTVLLSVVALLSGVALFACWLPARRVLKVDPVVALRAE